MTGKSWRGRITSGLTSTITGSSTAVAPSFGASRTVNLWRPGLASAGMFSVIQNDRLSNGADDRLRPRDQGVGDHAGDVLRAVEFGEIRVGRPVSHRHHLHPAHAGLQLVAPRDRAFDVERLDAVVAGARLEGGPAIPRGEDLERC